MGVSIPKLFRSALKPSVRGVGRRQKLVQELPAGDLQQGQVGRGNMTGTDSV